MKKTIISLALLAISTPAFADSVRCNGEIIENGGITPWGRTPWGRS